MNKKLYPVLAFNNIKRNKQTYLPYMLTCICTIIMYYIIHSISINEDLVKIRGGHTLKSMLFFGTIVIAIFSSIFLFYTNSFLIKQRKKELGLYNILGMGKRHIAKMMTFEIMFTSIISLVLGLLGGIVLSKLMFLILLKLLQFDIPIKFGISFSSILTTLTLFIFVFIATLLFNLAQIHISNPIELLRGGNVGEREPKTKWFLVIISIITLGTGYTIAIIVEKPTSAIGIFFVAVVLVIIGTYSLFTAGSIAFLKMLKKNKNFYYTTKYFVSISGMIYRMKQNAIGLANICILSTAVLVVLSATVSLYLGKEDLLKTRYPYDIEIISDSQSFEEQNIIHEIVDTQLQAYNLNSKNDIKYEATTFATSRDGTNFYLEDKTNSYSMIYLMNLNDYNRIQNKSASLNEDEILIYSIGKNYGYSEFNILDKQFKVKEEIEEFKVENKSSYVGIDGYYIILNNMKLITDEIDKTYPLGGETIIINEDYYYKFDLDTEDEDTKYNFAVSLTKNLKQNKELAVRVDNPFQSKEDFFTMYGGLFFIGILFGTLFLMATVLIIYYKQISEGIEDKQRFEIMQKVGMNKKEVKRSIQSQIVLIFFLPLIIAIVHMSVAFGVIRKLLMLFGFFNTPLFIVCTIVTILVFTAIYFIVYTLTARVYYKIVK